MDKLINIITRTSNRPKGFERNYISIKNQKYTNYRHIVLYDNHEDYENYLRGYSGIDLYFVDREKLIKEYKGPIINDLRNFWPSEHNLYCNIGLELVTEGYIIFLDDDDFLENPQSLSKISEVLDPDTLSIWQFQYDNGGKIPRNPTFTNEIFNLGNISSQCFGFHSKWKDVCRWDMYKCADHRFVNCLKNTISKVTYHPMVVVKVPSAGFGLKKDII